MKTLLLAGACLALTPCLAHAQSAPAADPMANVYGNTITLAIEPVWHARQYIDPDHTWRQLGDDGVVSGVWKVEDGQSCMTQTRPPGPTRCSSIVSRKVGDTWTNKDPTLGYTVEISLVAGRN